MSSALLRSSCLIPRSFASTLRRTAAHSRNAIAIIKTPFSPRLTPQARHFLFDTNQLTQSSQENAKNAARNELPAEPSKTPIEPGVETRTPSETIENNASLNYPIESPAKLSSYQIARCLNYGSQLTLHRLRMFNDMPLFSPSFVEWREAYPTCNVGDALQHVFNKGFPRDITTFNGILYEFAMAGLPKEAMEIFSHMTQNGIQSNGESYATVVYVYLGRRRVGQAVSTFHSVFDFYTEQAKMDASSVSAVMTPYFIESGMSALVANKDVKGAHMLWAFGVKKNVAISRRALFALIAEAGKAGEAEIVWDIRDALLRSVAPAMDEAVHLIICAHAAANDFGALWDMWQAISLSRRKLSDPNMHGFIEDDQVLHEFAKMAADSCVTGRHFEFQKKEYYGKRTEAKLKRCKIVSLPSDQRCISIVLEACGKLPRHMVELPANGVRQEIIQAGVASESTVPLGVVLARHAQCTLHLCDVEPNFHTRCKYVQTLSMQGAWQDAEKFLFETKSLKPLELAQAQRIYLSEMHKRTPKRAEKIISGWDVAEKGSKKKAKKAKLLPDGVGGIPSSSILATLPTSYNPPAILLSDQKLGKNGKSSLTSFFPDHSIQYKTSVPPMIRPELIVTVGALLQTVAELGLEEDYNRISERCIKELDGLARIGTLRIQDGLMPMSAMLEIMSGSSSLAGKEEPTVVAGTDPEESTIATEKNVEEPTVVGGTDAEEPAIAAETNVEEPIVVAETSVVKPTVVTEPIVGETTVAAETNVEEPTVVTETDAEEPAVIIETEVATKEKTIKREENSIKEPAEEPIPKVKKIEDGSFPDDDEFKDADEDIELPQSDFLKALLDQYKKDISKHR